MKKSEMNVSMPFTTYEELMDYKEKYINLKNDVCSLLSKTLDEGIDYNFDVKKALDLAKRVAWIPTKSNVNIMT